MPKEFTEGVLMRAFCDFSVALGRVKDGRFSSFGSGVLVRRGKRYGILTAFHCLHSCSPPVELGSANGDELWLILPRGRTIRVRPEEVVEHPLAKPKSEEFGPDLSFIEILALNRLSSFTAIGSFWSLDKKPSEVAKQFGKTFTPVASIGFPEFHFDTKHDGNVIRHQVKHMVYDNAIQPKKRFRKEGWDYLDVTIWYPGSTDLPPNFKGMSGGPVWGMQIKRDKHNGKFTIEKFALVGITFYEIYKKNDEGGLRAHFIKSIYDLAWKGID